MMHKALEDAGRPVELRLVETAKHAFVKSNWDTSWPWAIDHLHRHLRESGSEGIRKQAPLGYEFGDLQKSSKARHYAAAIGNPVLSTSVLDEKYKVVIYVSPSCSLCTALFYGLMNRNILNSENLEKSDVSFVFVPELDEDYEIIANLYCVEADNLIQSIGTFYKSLADEDFSFGDFSERTILDRLVSLSADVARQFGAQGSDLTQCQENQDFERAISAGWLHASRYGSEFEWPLVTVNGQSTAIKNLAKLMQRLKE